MTAKKTQELREAIEKIVIETPGGYKGKADAILSLIAKHEKEIYVKKL